MEAEEMILFRARIGKKGSVCFRWIDCTGQE